MGSSVGPRVAVGGSEVGSEVASLVGNGIGGGSSVGSGEDVAVSGAEVAGVVGLLVITAI